MLQVSGETPVQEDLEAHFTFSLALCFLKINTAAVEEKDEAFSVELSGHNSHRSGAIAIDTELGKIKLSA